MFEQITKIVGWLITITVISGILLVSPIMAYTTADTINFTVKDKTNVVDSGNSKYLIFTDSGVYRNEDSIWYWKWNSSDVYNDIQVGKTYKAKVYGFRVPFLSWYKNIVSVQ